MSALSLSAFYINEKISRLLGYSPYVIRMNEKTLKFAYYSFWDKNLLRFHFSWTFVTFILWPLATIHTVFYMPLFNPKQMKIEPFFFACVVMQPMLMANGANYVFLQDGDEGEYYLNLLLELRRTFNIGLNSWSAPKKPGKLLLSEIKKLFSVKTSRNFDIVGVFMLSIAVIMPLIPYVYIIAPLLTGFDVITTSLLYINKIEHPVPFYNLVLQRPWWILPAFLSVVACMETCRALQKIASIIVFASQVTLELVRKVERVSATDLSTAIEKYQQVYAVHVKVMRSQKLLVFVVLQTGIMLIIMSLTGTFLAWKFLPVYLYFLCPIMAVIATGIIVLALQFATAAAELSMKLTRKWRVRVRECTKGKWKVYARTIKTLQPMAFLVSCWGLLVPEMKANVLTIIVENTVDAVILTMEFIQGIGG